MANQTNPSFERLGSSWLGNSVEIVRPDSRVTWIVRRLKEAFNNQYAVEEFVSRPEISARVEDFLSAGGSQQLLFLYQRLENASGDIDENSSPELSLFDGCNIKFRGRGIYFLKSNRQTLERDIKSVEYDLFYGEVLSDTLQCLHMSISKIFQPCLENEAYDWGKASEPEAKEYLEDLTRFNEMLADAASSMQGGIQLRKLEKRCLVENKQQAYIRASQDPEILLVYESVMESWCIQCEQLLAESGESNDADDMSGPDTEFEFWRNRMAKFNSIAEQLKQKEHRCVIGVVAQAKTNVPSPTFKRWKAIDNQITDTLNEAKDNVKYLSALEKYTECLYTGTPQIILEALPALMNNIKMMFTIARYYGTTERMTKLLTKITNQMVVNCKNSINRPILNGPIVRLWDQDVSSLLDRLKATLKLYEAYQTLYRLTKEKLALQPKGKQFDFQETIIFDKFDQFCKRVQKLVAMFTTIQQFSSLAVSRIEGMESLIQNFSDIMTEFKRKPYDLLDYTKTAFNRDYLEHTVNISELEQQVQKFINKSFDNIISTEQSLELLRTFEKLLVRDVLRADLESKYDVIFQNYGQDLETVQWLYEKHKASPPMVRNMPPVIGNILWAQQLLHRVEDPMRRFKSSTSLMQNSKDAKRIIKNYNKVARALIEFETLWHNAWMKSVEAARSGLQATLIIRHPRTNRLFVNFDREILQLVREAKGLQRLGVEIPENARMVLVHEEKLKSYYNQLCFALKEYDRVVNMIVPVVRPLVKPHLDDIDMKIQPGMVQLTWLSMNIDGYLQRIHGSLNTLEEMVRKVNDIVEQRIDRNLKIISKSLLVDLPSNQSFTLEQFVQLQEKASKVVTTLLDSKNREIEQAVQDVIHLLSSYPLETDQAVPKEEIDLFWKHHGKMMYLSVLRCTKQSFFALKNRLSSRTSRGLFWVERPFFDVDVELATPSVTMNPSLDEIQISINRCALNILRCSKRIYQWNKVVIDTPSEDNSYHYLIGQDYQIVAVCLMLTGAVDSVKKQVIDYLQTFMKYDFLWKNNKESVYSSFHRTSPSLEDFDRELQRYKDIELKINDIPTVHNLGCLCLHTAPLKLSLGKEALSWKHLYGENLHRQGYFMVSRLIDYFRDLEQRLDKEISDLDHAQEMLSLLKEIRHQETEMDMQIAPIHAQYQLLLKHDIEVDRNEYEQVFNLASNWLQVLQKSRTKNDDLYRKQEILWTELNSSLTQFEESVSRFREDFINNGPMADNLTPIEAAERMKKFKILFQSYQIKWKKYVDGMVLFGKPIKNISDLTLTEQELEVLDQLYSLYLSVLDTLNHCRSLRWSDYAGQMDAMESSMKIYKFKCAKMPSILRGWRAFGELEVMIDDFLNLSPTLRSLSGRAIRQRHWRNIQSKISLLQEIDFNNLKVGNVLDMGLGRLKQEIEEICTAAVKEQMVESKLDAMKSEWTEVKFEFQNFKNRGPVVLKANVLSDIIEKCEDSTTSLSNMIGDKYSDPFKDIVNSWSLKLSFVGDVIEYLSIVQPLWIQMESVFSGADISKQMPLEAKRFTEIDKKYMKLISRTFEIPQVVECCNSEEMRGNLPYLKTQLELCQKSLTGYLESKRFAYPRFYFVSDALLLEILCDGTNIKSISSHVKHLFQSISAFNHNSDHRNAVTSIISSDSEEIILSSLVECRNSIEDFLMDLEVALQNTVRNLIHESLMDSNTNMVNSFPMQISALSSQILWTFKIEDAIQRGRNDKNVMPSTLKKFNSNLKELTTMLTRHIGPAQRISTENLILFQISFKEVFEDIIKKKVREITDFDWQKQRRFYWNAGHDLWDPTRQNTEGRGRLLSMDQDNLTRGNCILSVVDSSLMHACQLVCNQTPLVMTPVVDRYMISLIQALKTFSIGSLIGIAGSGKSESVKELGAAVGRTVISFVGSELTNLPDFIRFLKGLAMSGSWGLLDDFDRIVMPLLSIAAHQLQVIVAAQREMRKDVLLGEGQNITLNPDFSCFLTSNQYETSKTNLPPNLKGLLRCIGTTRPALIPIARTKLASCGYEEYAVLAKKLDCVYTLSKDLLSQQQESFNLRDALKVLRCAGRAKHLTPDKQEKQILVQVLHDLHSPRLNETEARIFLTLLNDIFPGITPEANAEDQKFKDLSKLTAEIMGLSIKTDAFGAILSQKTLQVGNLLLIYHGIVVLGAAGVGKSSIIELNSKLLTETTTRHIIAKIFPLTHTAQQLMGGISSASQEWEEGILPVLIRKLMKNTSVTSWIIFDGSLGPWTETLPMILNDSIHSKENTMSAPALKIIFETESLGNGSPGLLTNLGIVFMPESQISTEFAITKWLKFRPPKQYNFLKKMLSNVLPELLTSLKSFRNQLTIPHMTLVDGMLQLLSLILKGIHFSIEYTEAQLTRIVLFSICWSIGIVFEEDGRKLFDGVIRRIFDSEYQPPQDSTCFNFYVRDGEWITWKSIMEHWKPPEGFAANISNLIVPTVETTQNLFLLNLFITHEIPCVLIGAPGIGKSFLAASCLTQLRRRSQISCRVFQCSHTTQSKEFQSFLDTGIERRQGHSYGPIENNKRVCLVDDVHLPVCQRSQPQANELFRQLLQEKGYYDERRTGEWKKLVDHAFIACMTTQNDYIIRGISPRLIRNFCLVYVATPTRPMVEATFGSIFKAHFSVEQMGSEIGGMTNKLHDATITLWDKICKRFESRSLTETMYVFTFRDLFKILAGMTKCERDSISSRDYMLRLWIHECERVFTDSIARVDDQEFVQVSIIQTLEDFKLNVYLRPFTNVKFDPTITKDSPRILRTAGSHQSRGHSKNVSFEPTNAAYFWQHRRDRELDEEGNCIEDAKAVYELAAGGLEPVRRKILELKNTEVNKKSDIDLFPYAIAQILKILRIITTNKGHCMLLGRTGTGKQSLAKLAARLAGHRVHGLITADFLSDSLFETDMKGFVKLIVLEDQPVTCLVTTSDGSDAALIERISPIFGHGDLCDLIPKDSLGEYMRLWEERSVSRSDQNLSKSVLCESFVEQVRNNLHFVFCYSPSDDIIKILHGLPPLCKHCHVISFADWSNEIMLDVAKNKLGQVSVYMPETRVRLEALPSFMVAVHNSIEKIVLHSSEAYEKAIPPTNRQFIDLLSHFCNICSSESQRLALLIEQVDNGLEAIRSINEDILSLQSEIADSEIILNDSQKLTVEILKNISTRSIADDKKKVELQGMQSLLRQRLQTLESAKAEIDREMQAAKPILHEASSAVQGITQKDLQALKGLKNPPIAVKTILDGLLILLHRPLAKVSVVEEKGQTFYKDSFNIASAIIFESAFAEELMSFPVESITDECVELLQPYLEGPFFNLDSVKRVSGVATGVYLWISSIISYCVAIKAMRPKLNLLQKKEKEAREYEKLVAILQSAVTQAQEEVDFMQSQLMQSLEEKKRLQDQIDATIRKVHAANILVSSLSPQEIRWTERAEKYTEKLSKLVGDCAIAAVFLTYCGPFGMLLRGKIVQDAITCLEDRKVEFTANVDVEGMFPENLERTTWRSQGLVVNSLAVQNIILLRRAIRWPLLIDTHGQGLQWILSNEKLNEVKYVVGCRQLNVIAEECMAAGKPMVVEYAGQEWETISLPIADKIEFTNRGPKAQRVFAFGKEIECDPNFRMYIITKTQVALHQMKLFGHVSIFDFTLDAEGLKEQILLFVLQSERADILHQRKSVLNDLALVENKLNGQENEILARLSISDGSVLNDTSLVEFLGATIKSVAEAMESLKRVKESADSVLKACDEFKRIAEVGALLYGLNVEMGRVDPIYCPSLDQFMLFFKGAMDNTSKDVMSSKKMNAIVEELTKLTTKLILGGFFYEHRNVFLLLLGLSIQLTSNQVTAEQVDCFLGREATLAQDLIRRKPYSWIPDATWQICSHCAMVIPQLKELPESIQRLGDQWRAWCDAEFPEQIPFPDIASVPATKLDKINKLILVRAFRIDRIVYAIRQYLPDVLGEKYEMPGPSIIESLFASSTPRIPLLCLMSAEADPNEVITALGKRLKKFVRFVCVGSDQESTARRQLDTSISLGHWLVLENAHVNPKFLFEVEHHLKSIGSIEPEFRCWLTVLFHQNLPLGIAHMSIKISFEAPVGIKSYLDRCYTYLGTDFEETCSSTFKSLLLCLCVFQCLIEERAKFGLLGWFTRYESHHSDFSSCVKILQSIGDNDSKRFKDTDWQKLKYMIAEVEASGQFSNEWDRKGVLVYAEQIFNPAVFEPNYIIFKDLSISLSNDSNQSFRQAIERLDVLSDPENIGLFAGAGISKNAANAQMLLDGLALVCHGILRVHNRTVTPHDTTETLLAELGTKLPAPFSEVEVKSCLTKEGGPFSPINVVLQQEIDHINDAIEMVTSALRSLKGLGGTLVPDHEPFKQNLLLNIVPETWNTNFWTSSSISSWFSSLLLRYEQLRKWVDKGRPVSYWLGGLYRPSALIAAMKQEVVRKYAGITGWALEDVALFTEVSKMEVSDLKLSAEDGLYVHNLFLHGCAWSRKDSKLVDLAGKALSSSLHVLYIGMVQKAILKYDYPIFECPLFYTKSSSHVPPICSICLKSDIFA